MMPLRTSFLALTAVFVACSSKTPGTASPDGGTSAAKRLGAGRLISAPAAEGTGCVEGEGSECDDCVNANCCAAIAACRADPTCQALAACLSTCGGASQCDFCARVYGATTEYVDVESCVIDRCAIACGGL
jgi:hypothetical protein